MKKYVTAFLVSLLIAESVAPFVVHAAEVIRPPTSEEQEAPMLSEDSTGKTDESQTEITPNDNATINSEEREVATELFDIKTLVIESYEVDIIDNQEVEIAINASNKEGKVQITSMKWQHVESGEVKDISFSEEDKQNPEDQSNNQWQSGKWELNEITMVDTLGNVFMGNSEEENFSEALLSSEFSTIFIESKVTDTDYEEIVLTDETLPANEVTVVSYNEQDPSILGEHTNPSEVFENMSVSKRNVQPGDTVTFELVSKIPLTFTDMGIIFKDVMTGQDVWVMFYRTENPNVFQGTYTIPTSSYRGQTSWIPDKFFLNHATPMKLYSEILLFLSNELSGLEFTIGNLPIISVRDTVELPVGEEVDITSLFSIYDVTDGDITSQASLRFPTNIDWNQRGEYKISISVTNSLGIKTEKIFTLKLLKPEVTDIFIYGPQSGAMNVGDEYMLWPSITYIDMDYPSDFAPIWTSSDPEVVTVDEEGNLEAVSAGTAIITASYKEVSSILFITVYHQESAMPLMIDFDQTILNATYHQDLYIPMYANVNLQNVKVNGDIYVDGDLTLINTEINGTVYVDKVNTEKIEGYNFSYLKYNPDQSGVSFTADFPDRDNFYFRLVDDVVYQFEDKLYFNGFTYSSFYVLDYPGQFQSYPAGHFGHVSYVNSARDRDSIYVKFHAFNQTIEKEFDIKKIHLNDSGLVEFYPEIKVDNIQIMQGAKLDIRKYVEASDSEDGDLSDSLVIDISELDLNTIGRYPVHLSVTDSDELTSNKTIYVEVTTSSFYFHTSLPAYFDISNNSQKIVAEIYNTQNTERIEWRIEDPSIADVKLGEKTYNEERNHFEQEFSIIPKKRGFTSLIVSRGDSEYSFPFDVFAPKVIDFTLPKEKLVIPVGEVEQYFVPHENIIKQDNVYTTTTLHADSDLISIDSYNIKAEKEGKTEFTVEIGGIQKSVEVIVVPKISYSLYAKDITKQWYSPSWYSGSNDSKLTGGYPETRTMGFKMETAPELGAIKYQTYIRNKGWLPEERQGNPSMVSNDDYIEGLRVSLEGKISETYDLYYRVHTVNKGWLGWVKNGESTGIIALDDSINNFQAQILLKGETPPQDDSTDETFTQGPYLTYTSHVQSFGWQTPVMEGKMSGTSGQQKRLEGIKINLNDSIYNGSIEYKTHVQSYGWMDWMENGEISGTSGEAKRLEAIRIKLTGELAEKFDVYYRVHAQNFGWLDWAKNGEAAGTEGLAKRLEAIEIRLVKKGESAPGKTTRPYVVSNATVSYTTHVQSVGWQNYVKDGSMSGTAGKALRLEGIKIQVDDPALPGGIQYRTHVQSEGWQDWKTDDVMSGTQGKARRLEAIEIKLTGELAEFYDVYYRVHAQSYGWLGWAKNGESAGTEGLAKRLEGIEVRLVRKGQKAPGSTQGAFVKK